MDKLVHLACEGDIDCSKKCESNCIFFETTKRGLQIFGGKVSLILAGGDIDIAKLRKDERYKKAIAELCRDGFWIVKGNAFKKIEEELINGLLGLWAQK